MLHSKLKPLVGVAHLSLLQDPKQSTGFPEQECCLHAEHVFQHPNGAPSKPFDDLNIPTNQDPKKIFSLIQCNTSRSQTLVLAASVARSFNALSAFVLVACMSAC
jgi:hypothetical protein